MKPQHCILCWSCVIADMQSAKLQAQQGDYRYDNE